MAQSYQAQEAVGQSLTDEGREEAIKRAGVLMERRYADYAATGCFAALGDAHKALQMQRALIDGRSPEFVRQLEMQRGLV